MRPTWEFLQNSHLFADYQEMHHSNTKSSSHLSLDQNTGPGTDFRNN